MIEREWLACTDPTPMLEYLRETTSDRKLRLFGVAACYLIYGPGNPTKLRDVYEVVVGYADGTIAVGKVRKLWGRGHTGGVPDDGPLTWPEQPTEWVRDFVSSCHNREIGDECGYPFPGALTPYFRDIFGNPFRPVSVQPHWLTETVSGIATGIYAERAFDRMPILADALEDAGCDNAEVLNHCRGDGPHVRGCWAVDLLLGKE